MSETSGTDRTQAAGSGAMAGQSDAAPTPGSESAATPFYPLDPALFTIGGEIARGGMGRVVRAYDARLRRQVAIKELLADAPDLRLRFEREALITAGLQHPSIVNIIEAGRFADGRPFYAMKLVTGRPLDAVVASARTFEARLALLPNVIAVADALAYAHSRRVIHRDLKPANVLVGEFGETVVIDWGLAKDLAATEPAVTASTTTKPDAPVQVTEETMPAPLARPPSESPGASSGETVAGAVMGTPAYMPPEQAAGRPVDERADVYSLGAMLYQTLAGGPPYTGRSSDAILGAVLAAAPLPLERREPRVPPDLRAIVAKAMARDPADRYPTAREFAEDLKRFQTGALVGARQYSMVARVARWIRRHLVTVGLSVAFLVTLAVVGGVALLKIMKSNQDAIDQRNVAEAQRQRAEDQRHAAEESRWDLLLKQGRDALDRDPTEAVAWLERLGDADPAAARMVAADALARGVAEIVVRGASEPTLSADGRTLYAVVGKRLVACDLASGRVDTLGVQVPGRVAGIDVRNGRVRIAADALASDGGGAFDGLRLVDAATGQSAALAMPLVEWSRTAPGVTVSGSDAPDEIAVSPDGRYLVGLPSPAAIRVWDVDANTSRTVAGHDGTVNDGAFSADGTRFVSASDDGTIRVTRLADGSAQSLAVGRRVLAVKLFADGAHLAAWDEGLGVTILDVADGSKTSLGVAPGGIDVAGNTLIFAAGDGSVHTFDPTHGDRILPPGPSPLPAAVHLVVSPDGGVLAYHDGADVLALWPGLPEVSRLRGHQDDKLFSLQFTPDGRYLVSCSEDQLRVWPRPQPPVRRIETAPPGQGLAEGLTLSPDGQTLAITGSAEVTLWDLASGSLKSALAGSTSGVVAYSPRGDAIAAADDHDLLLFEATGAFRARAALGDEAGAVAFSPDGSEVAGVGFAGTVGVFDARTGAKRWAGSAAPGDGATYEHLAWSPDGHWLAATGGDNSLRLLDTASGGVRYSEGPTSASTGGLAFSPDGGALLCARLATDPAASLTIHDLQTGAARPFSPPPQVESFAFSSDGKTLALAAQDSTVYLYAWPSLQPAEPSQLLGALESADSLQFSPDNARLAAVVGQTVHVWDLTGAFGRTLYADDDIKAIAFPPDGRSLVGVTAGGEILVWPDDLPTDPPALAARIAQSTSATVDADQLLATPLTPAGKN